MAEEGEGMVLAVIRVAIKRILTEAQGRKRDRKISCYNFTIKRVRYSETQTAILTHRKPATNINSKGLYASA